MQLIYMPKDGPRQEFSFRPDEMRASEAEEVESVGGIVWDSWGEFGRLFFAGNMRARRAALWIFLRRTNPGLKFSDVDFVIGEVDIEFDDDEKDPEPGKDEPDASDTDST